MGDNLGATIAIRGAFPPAACADGAQTPLVHDGLDAANYQWDDGVLMVGSGAVTGSPSASTVDVELQHSDDGVTFAVAKDDLGNEYSKDGAIDGANQLYTMRFDRQALKRYLQVLITVHLTGGSTPKINLTSAYIFGGAHRLPTS